MSNVSKILGLVLLLLAVSGSLWAVEDKCRSCHFDFEDEGGPAHMIERDVHIVNGLGCADCHGGDRSLDDMDDVRGSKGYLGVPEYGEVPAFCARCHSNAVYMREHNPSLPTDQLDKYKTSVHGERLFEMKDTKVANCVSCHGVHEIGDAKMPHSSTHPRNIAETCGRCHSDVDYMAEYSISTSQVEDWGESVHATALLERSDLGAPACNDCHSNHGAAPPGVSSLSAVCGNCHAVAAELFDASPHQPAFAENDYPMCETCHSNHKILKPTDAMIGTEEPAVCADCHSADDGTVAFATAEAISGAILSLAEAHKVADSILTEAMEKGMMTTDEEFRLKEVTQALIQSRSRVHSFNGDSVVNTARDGIEKAEQVRLNSAALIEEYYFRRKGLGFATIFITILAIALYIKVRRLDKRLYS